MTTFFMFFFPAIGGGGAAVYGYGVGGPFVSEAYPITGVAGVPPPVVAVVRQTH